VGDSVNKGRIMSFKLTVVASPTVNLFTVSPASVGAIVATGHMLIVISKLTCAVDPSSDPLRYTDSESEFVVTIAVAEVAVSKPAGNRVLPVKGAVRP